MSLEFSGLMGDEMLGIEFGTAECGSATPVTPLPEPPRRPSCDLQVPGQAITPRDGSQNNLLVERILHNEYAWEHFDDALDADASIYFSENSRSPLSDASLGLEDETTYWFATNPSYSGGYAAPCTYICPRDLELEHPAVAGTDPRFGSPELPKRCLFTDKLTEPSLFLQSPGSSRETDRGALSRHRCEYVSHADITMNINKRRAIQERIAPIKSWLRDHTSSPYPNERQVSELSAATGLSDRQVRVCLSNLRARTRLTEPIPCLGRRANVKQAEKLSIDSELPLLHQLKNSGSICIEGWENLYGLRTFSTGMRASSALPQFTDICTNPTSIIDDAYGELDPQSKATREESSRVSVDITNKTPKRKGKRCYASRYRFSTAEPNRHYASVCPSDFESSEKPYQCTVCPKSFKDAYGWKRHEAGVHGFYDTEWTCMLNDMLCNGRKCNFCSEEIDDPKHFDQHNVSICLNKDHADRTFARKDLLKQHVRQIHISTAEDWTKKAFQVPESWIKNVDATRLSSASLWCGFCQIYLESTDMRMKHVADHFDEGLTLNSWQPHRE